MVLTLTFPDILTRWRIYIEECGLRGLCKQTRDFSFPEFKCKGRIDVGSFLNLADLIWGELLFLFSPTLVVSVWYSTSKITDIERTFEPHTFVQIPWIEDWFLAQVFASHITDFGLETRHLKAGVAKDNPVPSVPDTVLAKLVATFEAKLRRKQVALIPLVPRKPSMEITKKTSANKLRKRPSALVLHSNQSQSSLSRPGTPTSQNTDAKTQRQPNKLRKRSRSLTRSSPESIQQSLPASTPVHTPPAPAQVRAVTTRDGEREREGAPEVVFHRPTARLNLGPPPSPSHGRRFDDMRRRGSPEKVGVRPLQISPHPGRGRAASRDREIV